MEPNTGKSLRTTCFRVQKTSDCSEDLCSNRTKTSKHTAKVTLEQLQNKNVKVLEWSSQNPDLNPTENLWKHLIAVHQHSSSNSTELEEICKEECEKISKSRCAKLIQTYPRRLKAVIAAKAVFASTMY